MESFSFTTAIVTSALTVTGGLIVFAVGQLILKFIIEPLSDFRKIKSEISAALVFYANTFMNPAELNEENLNNDIVKSEMREVQSNLRKLASQLTGSIQVIPFYWFFWLLGLVPSRKKVLNISSNLIGISNNLWTNSNTIMFHIQTNDKRRNEIAQLLRLKLPG